MIEYSQNDVKTFASHLRTLGAYVQNPVPQIVGLSRTQVIGSQDAKSLYPTIVVLLNIGYDTFRGRIYEYAIVGRLFDYLTTLKEEVIKDKSLINEAVTNIRTALYIMAKEYAAREGVKDSTAKFKEFTKNFYGDLFRKLLSSKYTIDEIMNPTNDEQYYLCKSALFPLLEAINWMSEFNKGYSQVCTDWVFDNDNFKEKYKNKKFIILHDINSTKAHFKIYNMNDIINDTFKNYLITPYGTYFEKHDTKTSFECPLILNGMDDRAFVKNQFLIEGVILGGWNKLNQEQQAKFLIRDETLSEEDAKEIMSIVGDPDPKVQKWQTSVLKGIVFDNLIQHHELQDKFELSIKQKTSKSNGIKVTLNSGYGLNGLLSWAYGNNLIANSITTGGKIYGIKLFQQIASNKLSKERDKIKNGFYNEKYNKDKK